MTSWLKVAVMAFNCVWLQSNYKLAWATALITGNDQETIAARAIASSTHSLSMAQKSPQCIDSIVVLNELDALVLRKRV